MKVNLLGRSYPMMRQNQHGMTNEDFLRTLIIMEKTKPHLPVWLLTRLILMESISAEMMSQRTNVNQRSQKLQHRLHMIQTTLKMTTRHKRNTIPDQQSKATMHQLWKKRMNLSCPHWSLNLGHGQRSAIKAQNLGIRRSLADHPT